MRLTWITWKDVARCVSGRSGPPVSERCWRSAGLHGRGAGEVRKLSGKDLINRSGQQYFAVWRDLLRHNFLNCPPTKMKMYESLNLSDLHNKLMLLHIDVSLWRWVEHCLREISEAAASDHQPWLLRKLGEFHLVAFWYAMPHALDVVFDAKNPLVFLGMYPLMPNRNNLSWANMLG